MGGLSIIVRGVEDVVKDLARRQQNTEKRVGDELESSAKLLRDAQLDLARSPFRRRGLWRNVQDAPRRFQVSGNSLVDARMNADRTEARILTRAHVTTARSPAIKAVLERTGQAKLLRRTELWVKRGSSRGKKRSHKGHESRAGLQRVSLAGGLSRFGGSRKKHIREWALPRDLDKRDTVRLRGDALRAIISAPVLVRHESKIIARLNAAARKGLS